MTLEVPYNPLIQRSHTTDVNSFAVSLHGSSTMSLVQTILMYSIGAFLQINPAETN